MKVYLNIYDFGKINILLGSLGIGLYHTGVEIHDEENNQIKEYCFGGHSHDFSGIFINKPKSVKGFSFKESLYIGQVKITSLQFETLIIEIGKTFTGISYNAFNKNCNHFSNELIQRLFNYIQIPSYINRASKFLFLFSYITPKCLINLIIPNSTIKSK